MRKSLSALAALLLISCATAEPPPPAPETTLPIFGDGYPEAGDICRRVGESAETVEFLDHTADLIACPEAWDGRDDYARSVAAEEVLRQDGYVLYSVPLGF
jgi:hypothetical protein